MSSDGHTAERDRHDRLVVRAHDEVVRIAHDAATFSNAVSRHLQIPNGLDGPAHAAARRLLDPFFAGVELDRFQPGFERIARDLVATLRGSPFDAVADLGARFAVRAQSHWLGWPAAIEVTLLDWVADHRAAARAGDARRSAEVAARFDNIVRGLLDPRREPDGDPRTDPDGDPCTDPGTEPGTDVPGDPRGDVTTRLMRLRTDDGRALSDAEIISILRNWTGGDLSSIALCAGVVVHWLAAHPEHAAHLDAASDDELDAVIDEILRCDDPFVSNRRRATRDTVVAGCPVAAGEVVVLDWRAANVDPRVFGAPFAPAAHAADNLVYGTGPHVCPGRPLATRELRALVRALRDAGILEPAGAAVREQPPVAGYRTVPVRIVPAPIVPVSDR